MFAFFAPSGDQCVTVRAPVLQGLVLLLLAALIPPARAAGPDEVWLVQQVTGEAYVAQNEDRVNWTQLSGGEVLDGQQVVVTGPAGTAVLMHGEDVVGLAPRSTILLRETNGKNGMTRLEQTLGNIIVEVEKRPGWNFQVETPYLTAVAKGTKFGVSVDGSGARVDVRQGVVGVSDYSGHRADVGAGQTCSVAKGGGGVLVAPSPGRATKPVETIAI